MTHHNLLPSLLLSFFLLAVLLLPFFYSHFFFPFFIHIFSSNGTGWDFPTRRWGAGGGTYFPPCAHLYTTLKPLKHYRTDTPTYRKQGHHDWINRRSCCLFLAGVRLTRPDTMLWGNSWPGPAGGGSDLLLRWFPPGGFPTPIVIQDLYVHIIDNDEGNFKQAIGGSMVEHWRQCRSPRFESISTTEQGKLYPFLLPVLTSPVFSVTIGQVATNHIGY